MSFKRILLIPDAYLGDYSGAYVAQIAKRLLRELGHTTAVYTTEVVEKTTEPDGTVLYPMRKYRLVANWKQEEYERNYKTVLDDYKPDAVFTLGSVTNKPVCYWSIARGRGIKTISKIFMQDFFCANFYANDRHGLCTQCLDHGFYRVFFGNCHPYHGGVAYNVSHKILAAETRKKLRKELIRADAVITSSEQQIGFYEKYGIKRERCYLTPLYFNGEKLGKYVPTMGNYYVFVAQNRIDKGIHLLKDVLASCNDGMRVVAAYTSQARIDEALQKYGLTPFIESGILEMRPACTWNTNLGEVIAASRGVVNPSIWPSTTEYVLLETLGLRKPIFTFNVGIHPEILKPGENGFVAETPRQMAEQMNTLWEDDALYERVSIGAYNLYKTLTDWEGWKSTLSQIIEDVFETHGEKK